jgi:hypothetical protein
VSKSDAEMEMDRAWDQHYASKVMPGPLRPGADGRKLYFFEGLVLCETCKAMETSAKDVPQIDAEPDDVCDLCKWPGADDATGTKGAA